MRGAVASLAFELRRKFSLIPPPAIMFNICDLDTEKDVNTPEVVPGNDPWREIFTQPYTMEMKISFRKDAMGSLIYATVHDHLLDTVASSIRKRPKSLKIHFSARLSTDAQTSQDIIQNTVNTQLTKVNSHSRVW